MISGTRASIAARNGARSAPVGAPCDRRRAVVGVHGRAAEAGEVLGGGGHAAGAPAARPPPSPPRPPPSASRENARDCHRRAGHRRHVGDRRQRHVDARSAQRAGAGARVAPGDLARSAPVCRRRPGARCGSRRPPGRCRRSASPARRGAAARVSARSCSGEAMLSRNRIAPGGPAAAQRVGGRRPGPSCPGSAARRACRPAARAGAPRTCSGAGEAVGAAAAGAGSSAGGDSVSSPPAPNEAPRTNAAAAAAATAARRRRTTVAGGTPDMMAGRYAPTGQGSCGVGNEPPSISSIR